LKGGRGERRGTGRVEESEEVLGEEEEKKKLKN